MIISSKLTQEQRDKLDADSAEWGRWQELQENWCGLLEVILGNSTLEEVEAFALRVKQLPQYTEKQLQDRKNIRFGYVWRREFDPIYSESGVFLQGGFKNVEIISDPVETIALSESACKKGEESWVITI